MIKFLFFLIIFHASVCFSQFKEELSPSASQSYSPIIFEAIPYWTDDTTTFNLLVLYRVNPSFFFFSKVVVGQQESYEAKGELFVEILDEKDVSVTRDFRPIRIKRQTPPSEGSPFSTDIQGVFIFNVIKGLYRIVFEAKDIETGKSFIDRNNNVNAQYTSPSIPNISPAIFVEPSVYDTSSQDSIKITATNRSGNVVIGQKGGCLSQIIVPDTAAPIHLSWKLKSINEDSEEKPQELQGDQYLLQIGTPVVSEHAGSIYFSANKKSPHSRLAYIPIPVERLELGKYGLSITVSQNSIKAAKETAFNIIWPNKPRSLSEFKLAVDALRYIATEEEMEQMTVFNSSKAKKAFQEFWKKQNPDTSCAFNPAMAEYYRRVDEAIRRFSFSNETDGYRTDRGRIYILFGSPTTINRLLKPNTAPAELWTYEKQKKRFTFTDRRKTGNYILIKTENY